MKEITAKEVEQKLAKGEKVNLIDVREVKEVEQGAIQLRRMRAEVTVSCGNCKIKIIQCKTRVSSKVRTFNERIEL